ncbi:MAG: hypothetical protein R2867_44835 [Caldilineaceae bacterium]
MAGGRLYLYLTFLVQPIMTIGFLAGMVIRAGVGAERIFEVD